MDLSEHDNNIEKWFINRTYSEFPDKVDYVSNYKSIIDRLEPIHKDVNAGADFTDKTTLTRHDSSHLARVIQQISALLSYEKAQITPYEAFHLLVAVQIHDILNIEGREGHESNPARIFTELRIDGLIDARLLKQIDHIASCHAGSYNRGGKEEKDKIGFLLSPFAYKGNFEIKPQYLAALLRLADEYADEKCRSMSYLVSIGKVAESSIIHQKHAESLRDVVLVADSGIAEFDYYIRREDAVRKFTKVLKNNDTLQQYLLDEIYERTVKSHYETIYCMRFLRPTISVTKLSVSIEVEKDTITDESPIPAYELVEKGYPDQTYNIVELAGSALKKNGGYWDGESLKQYLTKELTY